MRSFQIFFFQHALLGASHNCDTVLMGFDFALRVSLPITGNVLIVFESDLIEAELNTLL